MRPENLEALTAKRICCRCVGEHFLSGQIQKSGQVAQCDYCGGGNDKTWSIGEIADATEAAFEAHMLRTPIDPPDSERAFYADPDMEHDWFREGMQTTEAIEEMAQMPIAAASDVQTILEDRHNDFDTARMGEETEFSTDACYVDKRADAAEWYREWYDFQSSLKTQARYFNPRGLELLTKVFRDVDQLRTKPRHPAVLTVGPKCRIKHFYRARVFQSVDKLTEAIGRPDLHIGAPPAHLSSAGRMNAIGISVFYAATHEATALAEVRPPVGSKVVLAKFKLLRPLQLLDLTALDHARDGGSIFDPSLKPRLERVAFLQTLGAQLSQPVMPDDEAFDYLITQAIADFLATQNNPRLDGIVFASAQAKIGRNVVLFPSAAQVKPIELPEGTKINPFVLDHDEDGEYPGYWVSEEAPAEPRLPSHGFETPFHFNPLLDHGSIQDLYSPSLEVDLESVKVHHVERVQVHTEVFSVKRRRSRSHAWKF